MKTNAPAPTRSKARRASSNTKAIYADHAAIPTRRERAQTKKASGSSSSSMGIVGPVTGKPPNAANAAKGRAVPDLSFWQQAGRLGGKLTPVDISAIIRQADQGYPVLLMDLANECRQKDSHLSAVLTVAEESIAGLPWQLKLPEDARAKDKRAAKWVEAVLRNTPALRKLIAYLAGARFYGYDVNEVVWKKEKGKMVPSDFCHLSHRRFGFDPLTGTFVLRDQGMPQYGIDFRNTWPNKFIVSQPRANGDAPQREGLCRPLIWMTHFRVWVISDWLRTAEMSWKPWRIGTYKKGSSATEDEEALEIVLEKMTTSGWATKPDNMEIEIEWPAGNASTKATHAELVNVLAAEMSKAILGQTETTQASGSSGYAQAKVHDDVRRDIRESAAMQIAADLTRDLIGPMIALNFADDIAVPQFEFVTKDPIDLTAFSEAVKNLVEAQLEIPAKWVRDNAGMPEPKDGEDVIGGKPELPVLDPNADPNAPPTDPNAKPGDKPKPATDKKPTENKPAANEKPKK